MLRVLRSTQGSLKVRALHVSGFLKICADGVDLRDPDGNRTLAAERVCVKVNPLALKAKRLWVSEAVLEKPWIEIAAVEGPDGKPATTLSRALAPKKPKVTETTKQSGTFDWTIDVGNLAIHGGTVAIRPGVGEPATFAFDSFELGQAHAKYAQNGAEAALQLAAELKAPPAPWITRPRISTFGSPASAASTEPPVNAARPMRNTRLRPNMSPNRPRVTTRTVTASR